jgi:hypothetical protein
MASKDKDHLEVIEGANGYFRLQWWLPEEDDYGAIVGEAGSEPTKDNETDLEWYTAEIVCFRLHKANPDSDTFGLDSRGFFWTSKSGVSKVLSQINVETRGALQSKSTTQEGWPEWALTAKTNGWRPPKGWKP